MPPPTKQEVFLFRHAQDFEPTPEQKKDKNFEEVSIWDKSPDWDKNKYQEKKWFSETLPDGREVRFPWKRLNHDGKKQAIVIKDFMLQQRGYENQFYPISRVVIQDPSGPDNSQNTFYTVWELIKALNTQEEKNRRGGRELEVNLLGLDKDFDEDSILDILTKTSEDTSTVICLDRQHLWGYQTDDNGNYILNDGKRVKQPKDKPPGIHSIVGRLGNHLFGNFYKNFDKEDIWRKYLNFQEKAGVIYRLVDLDNDWRPDLEQYNWGDDKRFSFISAYNMKK